VTIDEQLKRLEEDVRRLKIEFDIFFNGGTKRPPYDTKSRVESQIKRLGDERRLSFGQRFYYNSIVARYVAFKELWRRTMQSREEGLVRGREMPAAAAATSASAFSPVSIACSDGQDQESIKRLYDSLVEAKRTCGEQHNLSFEQFQSMISARTTQLRAQLNCSAINYTIAIEDEQVKFKAKPVR
jgi:hypothetical protein